MLLRLDCLVKAVRVAPSGHDASRKSVYNKYLVVLHHIVLITEHQIMGAKRQNDIMLDLQVLRIGEILNMEKVLHLLHACFRQIDDLILLIDDEITRLLLHYAHDGIHLGQLLHILAPVHPARQQIAHLIQGGGFAALSRNNKRRPCFVN